MSSSRIQKLEKKKERESDKINAEMLLMKKHSAIIDRRNESYIQWIWWTGIKYCHRLKRQKQQNARIFLSKMCNWMCNNNKNVEVWSKHGVKIAWIFVEKITTGKKLNVQLLCKQKQKQKPDKCWCNFKQVSLVLFEMTQFQIYRYKHSVYRYLFVHLFLVNSFLY